MFTLYENTAELIADWRKAGSPRGNFGFEANGESLAHSIEQGDESLVPKAEKFMDQIEAEVPDTLTKEFRPHVYGPVLSIPDYLTGIPTPFRRQQEVESTTAPLKLIICGTSSCAVSSKALQRRGVAISALVLKLQAVRPVDIIIYGELDSPRTEHFNNNRNCRNMNWTPSRGRSLMAVKLESRPLSVAHALNLLCNSGVYRNMFYPMQHVRHGSTGYYWPEDWRTAEYEKWVLQQFQAEENDIFVPASFSTDKILVDPIGWINNNLAKLGYHVED